MSALKRAVDRARGIYGHYLLTGSQQWQVLKQLSESLAGRAAFLDLQGLSLAELTGHDAWQELGRFVRLMGALTAQEVNASHLGLAHGWRSLSGCGVGARWGTVPKRNQAHCIAWQAGSLGY